LNRIMIHEDVLSEFLNLKPTTGDFF